MYIIFTFCILHTWGFYKSWNLWVDQGEQTIKEKDASELCYWTKGKPMPSPLTSVTDTKKCWWEGTSEDFFSKLDYGQCYTMSPVVCSNCLLKALFLCDLSWGRSTHMEKTFSNQNISSKLVSIVLHFSHHWLTSFLSPHHCTTQWWKGRSWQRYQSVCVPVSVCTEGRFQWGLSMCIEKLSEKPRADSLTKQAARSPAPAVEIRYAQTLNGRGSKRQC